MSHSVVEKNTEEVLNKSFRHEKAFPRLLSGCPTCCWGRELLITPPALGQMSPKLPSPSGHRLRQGQWFKVIQHSQRSDTRPLPHQPWMVSSSCSPPLPTSTRGL